MRSANNSIRPPGGRRNHRYAVQLLARSRHAEHSVENLSRGGLYLRGLEHLEPGDQIGAELELPGGYRYVLLCRVAYVLDERAAAACGRGAGAGVQIIEADPGYHDAVEVYLDELNDRA